MSSWKVGFSTSTALVSTIFVLMMTLPGLALFYGSLISRKNLVDTMLQSVVITCYVSIVWWFVGYSLCFGASVMPFCGGLELMFLDFDEDDEFNGVPEAVWCAFQLTFAIITPAVVTGAVAERSLLWPLMVFASLWMLVVYCPICHMVWGPDGLLLQWGVLDLAGGLVVETCSGVSAVVLCFIVGPRAEQTDDADPARAVLHIVGASLLWVGWLAFNAGSAMANGFQASIALLNTQLCAAAGAVAWFGIASLKNKRMMPHTDATFNLMGGAIAGLVAATPSSGFVTSSGAVFIGIGAGYFCFMAENVLMDRALTRWGLDDAVSVFPVHGVGGIWGTLMTGVFARKEIGGTSGALEGNPLQVAVQIAAISVVILWSAIGTAMCAKLVESVRPLRASAALQERGMDFHHIGGWESASFVDVDVKRHDLGNTEQTTLKTPLISEAPQERHDLGNTGQTTLNTPLISEAPQVHYDISTPRITPRENPSVCESPDVVPLPNGSCTSDNHMVTMKIQPIQMCAFLRNFVCKRRIKQYACHGQRSNESGSCKDGFEERLMGA